MQLQATRRQAVSSQAVSRQAGSQQSGSQAGQKTDTDRHRQTLSQAGSQQAKRHTDSRG